MTIKEPLVSAAWQRADLRDRVAAKQERILFASACGPLLYGFPCTPRYVELRGVHVESSPAPQRSSGITATREWREHLPELQVEWVSHEVGKFVRLLQLNNGSAYEQLFSPFEVYETAALADLREIARAMVSQQLFLHYAAFFRQQLQLFRGQHDKHGRHVLYLCRVALTGLHLAERGQLLADLRALAQFHERVAVLALLDELDTHADVRDPRPYMRELEALGQQLAHCGNPARLPELVPHRDAAEDWLARLRER